MRAIAVLALLVASVVLDEKGAGADEVREEARSHFVSGKAHFAAGRYLQAREAFEAAYAIAPFPELIYNIGRCQEELHDAAGAIASYERYLPQSAAADRIEVETRIEVLRRSQVAGAAQARRSSRPRRLLWVWTTLGVVLVAGTSLGLGLGLTVGREPALTYAPVRP